MWWEPREGRTVSSDGVETLGEDHIKALRRGFIGFL